MELPLQQHPTFGAALERIGTKVTQIEIEGAAPIQAIKRFGVTFAPRGPIWEDENPDALRQTPLRMINAERPSDVYRRAGFCKLMTPAHVAELDLRDVDWRAKAKGKWRNAWRKSENANLRLQRTVFHPTVHDWLLQEDHNQQRQKKFRALPHSLIHAYSAVKASDVIVFTAKRKKACVAAMLFLRHGQVATYHLGWSNTAGREANAHYALLRQAADYFVRKGVTRLDLGVVDTENAPGLARFKIGSGAAVRPLGGTWFRIPGL